ncbi:Sulfotransferase domain protein [Planctomycetes bacterium MalM25]|nr:Sulfotransferase domain protein [Planctomycetes bacterium MalM25]
MATASSSSWSSETHRRRRRLRIPIAASHHVTRWLAVRFPGTFPLLFVYGYPKSGTSWASQLIADALRLPYPQHSVLPIGFEAVQQTHASYSPANQRAAYVMRDGRDVMVSLYFHLIANRERSGNAARYRSIAGLGSPDQIHELMPEFIQGQASKPFSSSVNWAEHVSSRLDANANCPVLRYEDLLSDGVRALQLTLEAFSSREALGGAAAAAINRFDFGKTTGRERGQSDPSSFLRSGRQGEWIKYFSREAAEVFDRHFGEVLVESGYAAGRDWVSEHSESIVNTRSA